MVHRSEEFLQGLRATFRVEAAEHLQLIATGLLELERTPASPSRATIEGIFRAAHSLKGAARAVEFGDIEALCQALEETFAGWKHGRDAPSRAALDAVHATVDAIHAALGPQAALRTEAAPAGRPEPSDDVAATTVRVAVDKLEARLLEAEELLEAKLMASQRVAELRELAGQFEAWRNAWTTVQPVARRLRAASATPGAGAAVVLPPLLDFVDWSADYLKTLEATAARLSRAADHDRHTVERLVDDVVDGSKRLLLLPFGVVTAGLPKLVRDLCRDQRKEAELTLRGQDIEVDKQILEQMRDPLVHLLRNSVDHGIETSAERVRQGKPARGSIAITVSQLEGGKIQILVADDGAGIDPARIREAARDQGLITAEEAAQLDDDAARELAFRSEVTTRPAVTAVSGRGLGLAIVREKTEALAGTVTIAGTPRTGTEFRIVLPMTRATFRGVLVEAGGATWVVPTAQVRRVLRVRAEEVQTVGSLDTLMLDGRTLALVHLAAVLEMPTEAPPPGGAGLVVMVLGTGDQRIAFAVDAVLNEIEVLCRPLRKPLSRVRNVAGAAILGSGRLAPVLDVNDLLKSARRAGRAVRPAAPSARPIAAQAVLVAEDSITSRLLLKAILESAGYRVRTAADGMEAFALLRAEPFDAVVSDVEMPRLNGFDLTARIRADRNLAPLPVVLVTALETREERERGIDVGADAYIAKSSFDQSDLLETLRRLVGAR